MKRASAITIGLLIVGLAAFQASDLPVRAIKTLGWTTLFDGKNLQSFNMIGDANWQLADGVVQANKGTGFLVSKNSYGDFQLKAEFWVDDEANSGIFIRCDNPQMINAMNAYEVNIYDKRPDPSYGTGAIVDVAKADNHAEGRRQAEHLRDHSGKIAPGRDAQRNGKPSMSRIPPTPEALSALQYGAGTVKFRQRADQADVRKSDNPPYKGGVARPRKPDRARPQRKARRGGRSHRKMACERPPHLRLQLRLRPIGLALRRRRCRPFLFSFYV